MQYLCLFTDDGDEGHQYRRTDGLVGTGLMPYKAHSPNDNYRTRLAI